MESGPQLIELFEKLTTRLRWPEKLTVAFSAMGHNDDLCPRVQARCTEVLASFRKFYGSSHDIQGFRDAGTDIAIKLATSPPSFICFQAKSDNEIKKGGLLPLLKTQLVDSQNRYGASAPFFILLCGDMTPKGARDPIREIEQQFVTHALVRVVEPAAAFGFLFAPASDVDALIKSHVSSEDTVLAEAAEAIGDFSAPERAIFLYVLLEHQLHGKHVTQEQIRDSNFVRRIFSGSLLVDETAFNENARNKIRRLLSRGEIANIDERLIAAIDRLSGGGLEDNQGFIEPAREQSTALLAIMYDAEVRFGYQGEELLEYVFSLVESVRTAISV